MITESSGGIRTVPRFQAASSAGIVAMVSLASGILNSSTEGLTKWKCYIDNWAANLACWSEVWGEAIPLRVH